MASIAIDRLDGLSSSSAIKGPVRVATTANIALTGLQTVDGVSLAAQDRVLVKDQTDPSENGIYRVDTGPWVRVADFNRTRDISQGTLVFVTSGTTEGGNTLKVTSTTNSVGSSDITFAKAVASAADGVLAASALQPSYLGFSDTDSDANVLARLPLRNLTHQPEQYSGILGSLGKGAIFREVTRTGGYGSYGDILVSGVVSAATVTGEFDVGITSWMTQTNLQGGQIFGGWDGANTPAAGSGTYTGGAAIGREINVGNRWGDTGLLTNTAVTRYTAGLQIVPDVTPTRDTVTYEATISVASPAVVSRVGHGLPADTPVRFSSTGALPTGITAGTIYYVSATGLTADTYQLKSAVVGGSAINTSAPGSGTHTYIPSFPGNFAQIIARSIHDNDWWIGTLINYDAIHNGGYGVFAAGGSTSDQDQPDAYLKVAGFWKRGLDFEGADFSDAVFNFDFTNQTSATATAGGLPSPGGFAGYIKVMVSGTLVKIPYFGN